MPKHRGPASGSSSQTCTLPSPTEIGSRAPARLDLNVASCGHRALRHGWPPYECDRRTIWPEAAGSAPTGARSCERLADACGWPLARARADALRSSGSRLADRRFRAPLLAFIVVVEERALGADDLAAVVAVGLEAVLADQRADPRRLQLDRIERVEAGQLDVEFGSGVAVEQRQRTLRGRVPFAVGGAGETADAAQLGSAPIL